MRATLVATAAALLLGCRTENPQVLPPVDESPSEEAVPAPPPAPKLQVHGASATLFPAGARGTADVDEVRMELTLSGLGGAREVVLEVVAPGGTPSDPTGTVYLRKTVVLDDGTDPRPRAEFRMPVAGTFITQNRLAGTWDARFFLDGALVASTAFTLEP